MDENTTGRVVLANPGIVLVTAHVKLTEYAKPLQAHHAAEVTLTSLKPLVFITGIGFNWVQTQLRDGVQVEMPGVHLMPWFVQLELGQAFDVVADDYQKALSHFMATDPFAQHRAARGLVAEITTEEQKTVVNLLADYEKPGDGQDWAFRLNSISPPRN